MLSGVAYPIQYTPYRFAGPCGYLDDCVEPTTVVVVNSPIITPPVVYSEGSPASKPPHESSPKPVATSEPVPSSEPAPESRLSENGKVARLVNLFEHRN
jgi:hypothetical protein